jgi:hypothetical protein
MNAMSTVVDGSRTEAFAEQALDIANGGCWSLMLRVDHRIGLFDTMAVCLIICGAPRHAYQRY